MSNPIPQVLPSELVGTDTGRYIQELIFTATQLRDGVTANPLPNKIPVKDAAARRFFDDLSKVLDQIRLSETPSPLNYQIPYDGELYAFLKEFLDAAEALR